LLETRHSSSPVLQLYVPYRYLKGLLLITGMWNSSPLLGAKLYIW